MLRWFSVLCAALILGGCAAPSQVLFGASFPDWMFCMIGGVLCTVIIHSILRKFDLLDVLQPVPISHIALTAIFSVLIWVLVFFR